MSGSDQERTSHMAPNGEAPLTVLFVDDHVELARSMAEALTFLGRMRVVTAHDGATALESFFREPPDCVVIDITMPNLDGVQLVRALRGDPESAGVPLIILSALVQDADVYRGLAAGADQYLLKPTRPTEVIATIRRVVAISAPDRMAALQRLANQQPPVR